MHCTRASIAGTPFKKKSMASTLQFQNASGTSSTVTIFWGGGVHTHI